MACGKIRGGWIGQRGRFLKWVVRCLLRGGGELKSNMKDFYESKERCVVHVFYWHGRFLQLKKDFTVRMTFRGPNH